MRFEDLTGSTFGRWTVIKRVENSIRNETQYLCECQCGTKKIIKGYALKNGNSKSCGCLRKELSRKNHIKHNKLNTRLYNIWHGMKKRCYEKTGKDFKNYGARNIEVCKEWLDDFMNFYNWSMANGYQENLTIDRIDVNGNYCPENCRWATAKEQANNRRSNCLLTYNNETYTLKEWANKLKIKYTTFIYKIRKGSSIDEIINC